MMYSKDRIHIEPPKFISSFMYHSVYDEKLNLLAWAIRPIFSDQVRYQGS